jgi:hypothetical protein
VRIVAEGEAAVNKWDCVFRALSNSERSTVLALVILSAAKNLVLYRDVASFLWGKRGVSGAKKGAAWVLEDEILRCAQNDKGHLYPILSILT